MSLRSLPPVAATIVAALLLAPVAFAIFTESPSVGGNTFTNDTLNPPAGLTASGGASITLDWTATVDTYAAGHRVYRATASGGPYSQIAEVTPRTTVTYNDAPAAGTYYYVVRAYYQSWESADSSEASATVGISTGFRDCSAQAAVTAGSGDNDGFQTTPLNACSNDAASAQDVNSGTGAPDTCTSAKKDRHLYYDYGFAVPAGSTINGIEVRLDAWADNTSFSPFMCAELSWDGGATWTAAKSTPNLGATESTFTLGSASDTWGRTWSAGDFSNANLRVRVTNVSGFNGRDFFLDWVAVQVTYTP